MKIKKENLNNNIFIEYFKECYDLQFKEKPDYNKLIKIVKKININT